MDQQPRHDTLATSPAVPVLRIDGDMRFDTHTPAAPYATRYAHHAPTVAYPQIITLLYDDVANDPANPFPGKLFNKPTTEGNPGVDVYTGCKKSYTGNDVTAANVLAILTGNASAVTGGSGEVLKSGPDDHVFVNFVDHGAAGLVVGNGRGDRRIMPVMSRCW